MTSHARGRVLPVLIATVALVGAANLGAYAANGRPLLLGGHNSAHGTTTLTTTSKGPALTLHTPKKAPPLAVSSGKLVKRLNADRVDGRDASQLASAVTTYRLPDGPTQQALVLPKPGTYLISVSVTLSSGSISECWIEQGGPTGVDPLSIFGTVDGGYQTVTGSGVTTITAKTTGINFRCLAPIYSTTLSPSTISFISIPAHHAGRFYG
jgi:hypothetical protein